jgi:hypothetical protein
LVAVEVSLPQISWLSKLFTQPVPSFSRDDPEGDQRGSAMDIFTSQSAKASDTQSGACGPTPSIGRTSPAQDTSLPGSTKAERGREGDGEEQRGIDGRSDYA